jgi:formate dehydrogenase subunit gamma
MSHAVHVSPEQQAKDQEYLAKIEATGVTRYIKRHSLQARITHDVTIIVCLWLMISGAIVFAPPLTQALGANVVWVCRMSHRVLGVVFCLVPIISFFLAPKGARHIWEANVCKWTSDDKKWMLMFFPYLFGAKWIHMPDQDMQKSGQRFADGMLWIFGFVMAISGVVLTLGSICVDLSANAHALWLMIHDIGFFALCIFVPAHIWLGGGIFQPYRGNWNIEGKTRGCSNLMFGDGMISESDALYHWGHWAREELASGKNVVYKDKDGNIIDAAEIQRNGAPL